MKNKKRIGIYLPAEEILKDPQYLDVLQKELGLNMVIVWLSWGKLSPKVEAANPLLKGHDLKTTAIELLARQANGDLFTLPDADPMVGTIADQAGPFFPRIKDDSMLRKAISEVQKRGMEAWLSAWAWTGWRSMYCPGRPEVTDWLALAFADFAKNYGAQGLDITHARFPAPLDTGILSGCACKHCAKRAGEMGYDFDSMISAIRVAGDGGLIQGLANGSKPLLQWLDFRNDLITSGFRKIWQSVHASVDKSFVFGSDNYPSSLSRFSGQRHTDWPTCSDFASPLVSHVGSFILETLESWALSLRKDNPALSEADALAFAYKLAGYADINLPSSIEKLNPRREIHDLDNLPLVDLLTLELQRAKKDTGGMPSYPIIHGEGWSESVVRGIMNAADKAGHDGIVFQGTSSLVKYPKA